MSQSLAALPGLDRFLIGTGLVRWREKSLDGLLGPQLLFGDQALHKFGTFLLIGLDALVKQHFADLRYRSLLLLSTAANVASGLSKARLRQSRNHSNQGSITSDQGVPGDDALRPAAGPAVPGSSETGASPSDRGYGVSLRCGPNPEVTWNSDPLDTHLRV